MQLKLLVIGSGGREHALGKKLIQSQNVSEVFCAKGNPGMKQDGIQIVDIGEDDHDALIKFAKENQIDWTIIGPEVALMNGIVDDFSAAGLLVFGPDLAAARIEGSKDFAKEIMKKYQIPTANHQTFTDLKEAQVYIEKQGVPIVIKADGLAAGKGVIVAETQEQATVTLQDMLAENKFGDSGAKVVIEDFLAGQEFSLLSFVRGAEVYPMIIAQDHKRAYENDLGPNTGGMGAYSPVPQIPDDMIAEVIDTIVKPTARALVEEGCSFTGILYAGLIATDEGAKVIEFNARFGDPEAQVVLPHLESDFAIVIDDLLKGKRPQIHWRKNSFSLGVVVAAEGYPGTYEKEIPLPEITTSEEFSVYYAGVKEVAGKLVSNGGRVFLVEASGETLSEAQAKVYNVLDKLDMPNLFYRKDIGAKALN
ncbi:phosphoribosylamine--glycine ligase [Enterococcus sp. LJL99]